MFDHSKQTIFIEYIMLDGVNDQEQHAHQLGKLLEMFKAVRNFLFFLLHFILIILLMILLDGWKIFMIIFAVYLTWMFNRLIF